MKNQKGITLIALVITIIVLLILAGVTIATLTGENGILTQADAAKDNTNRAEAIEKIKRNGGLEALPEDLREIAKLRLENPEMSLRDLGQNLTVKISRSGANHRMQKILEIAQSQEALTNG